MMTEISSMKQPVAVGRRLVESQGAFCSARRPPFGCAELLQHARLLQGGLSVPLASYPWAGWKEGSRARWVVFWKKKEGSILKKQLRKYGDLSRSLSQEKLILHYIQFSTCLNIGGLLLFSCANQSFLHSIRPSMKWGTGSYIRLNHITLVGLLVKWSNVAILYDSACHFWAMPHSTWYRALYVAGTCQTRYFVWLSCRLPGSHNSLEFHMQR